MNLTSKYPQKYVETCESDKRRKERMKRKKEGE